MKDSPTISSAEEMKTLVSFALEKALELGATSASAEISEERGRCLTVRNQAIESIEHTHDRNFSVTVFIGKSRASASGGDLRKASLTRIIRAATDMARYTAEDACAGLPDADRLCRQPRSLDLWHPWRISVEQMTEIALSAESSALRADPLVTNSDGASIHSSDGNFILGNTEGFLAGFPFSQHSIDVSVVAENRLGMQSGNWYSLAEAPDQLEDPRTIGRIAAERAVRALSPRQISTRKCPVIFEAPVAQTLFRSFVNAVSGSNLYKDWSFLKDALGTSVFPSFLTIRENPFIARAYGSGPFDDEGVEPEERDIVEQGVLKGYFLSSYSARKLGMRTTGNAGGPYNLLFRADEAHREATLADLQVRLGTGLLITELMGQGINLTTGDFSQGASGFWIENGVICYPVDGITVAGNLRNIFRSIEAMACDQDPNALIRCGSVLVPQMTVAGA